jgi:hypothetical protein
MPFDRRTTVKRAPPALGAGVRKLKPYYFEMASEDRIFLNKGNAGKYQELKSEFPL